MQAIHHAFVGERLQVAVVVRAVPGAGFVDDPDVAIDGANGLDDLGGQGAPLVGDVVRAAHPGGGLVIDIVAVDEVVVGGVFELVGHCGPEAEEAVASLRVVPEGGESGIGVAVDGRLV